jgi:hypothetical protein
MDLRGKDERLGQNDNLWVIRQLQQEITILVSRKPDKEIWPPGILR